MGTMTAGITAMSGGVMIPLPVTPGGTSVVTASASRHAGAVTVTTTVVTEAMNMHANEEMKRYARQPTVYIL